MLKLIHCFRISLRELILLVTALCAACALLIAANNFMIELGRWGIALAILGAFAIAMALPERRNSLCSFVGGTILFQVFVFINPHGSALRMLFRQLWWQYESTRSFPPDQSDFVELGIVLLSVFIGLTCAWVTRSVQLCERRRASNLGES